MIRRPISSIELKLDDLQEYTSKKEQQQQANASQSNSTDANASMYKWSSGAKSTKEIHERIGLTQQQNKRNNPPS